MQSRKRGGFTLVEILIVVVILGILAAIVIPQFTNASESAKASSLTTQLSTIRAQLELAQIQHQGEYPNLSANWDFLTTVTDPMSDASGNYTAADSDTDDVGPYLQQPPVNPFENSATVSGTAAAGVGWVYNQSTGQITACVSNAKITELGLPASDVTGYGS